MIDLENCMAPGIPSNGSSYQTNWEPLIYQERASFIQAINQLMST
jgi:hypothetical protein